MVLELEVELMATDTKKLSFYSSYYKLHIKNVCTIKQIIIFKGNVKDDTDLRLCSF